MKKDNNIIEHLKSDYPYIKFVKGNDFVWASKDSTVTYKNLNKKEHTWALMHETAHAHLKHESYQSDQHLLSMELAAWQEAKNIAKRLDIVIDQNHIEDCLDTYRDWLHTRSACPECQVTGFQKANRLYKCFNCQCVWHVPDSPLCKVSRRKVTL